MSNYLFYTLIGYAAGLATSIYIDIIMCRRIKQKEEGDEVIDKGSNRRNR